MTDSKVAKNMLLKKQKPKTTDEKMIVNNYRIMTYIKDEMKNENLSLDALLYIQKELTK